MCSTFLIAQKCFTCGKVGGGGGDEMVHVSGGRGFVWGFREWRCELSSEFRVQS